MDIDDDLQEDDLQEPITAEQAVKLATGHAIQAEAMFRTAEEGSGEKRERRDVEMAAIRQEVSIGRALHHATMARMWVELGAALPSAFRPIPASSLDRMEEATERIVAEHELGAHNDFGDHPDCPKCQAAPA